MSNQHLLALADLLDGMDNSNPDLRMGFDMSTDLIDPGNTTHPCGSACCIGGWVQYLHPQLQGHSLSNAVLAVSDMSEATANRLCWDGQALYGDATPQDGAQAIRNAIEFDDPKWDEILRPY